MPFMVTKASGEQEAFNIKKFSRSLRKAGATDAIIEQLIEEIQHQKDLRSTKDIYRFALKRLKKKSKPTAARYNLKQALLELGPAGFPFERFCAQLFAVDGYTVEMNKVIQGACVEHETDFVGIKKNVHLMSECKFHNQQKLTSDLKVALYVKARFDDINAAWEQDHSDREEIHQAWVITNTRFTSQAIRYAECAGINLLSWSYPLNNSLADRITKSGLHPITALTSLNTRQKREFIKAGFVLCRDAHNQRTLLNKLGFSPYKAEQIIQESESVCSLSS